MDGYIIVRMFFAKQTMLNIQLVKSYLPIMEISANILLLKSTMIGGLKINTQCISLLYTKVLILFIKNLSNLLLNHKQ